MFANVTVVWKQLKQRVKLRDLVFFIQSALYLAQFLFFKHIFCLCQRKIITFEPFDQFKLGLNTSVTITVYKVI